MERHDRKNPQLCQKESCTACSACYNICNSGAINMVEDEYGELHPSINPDQCVKCGLCEKVCPELGKNEISRNGKPEIYACWLKDSSHRKQSTSGGAAFAISSAVIKQGGHVWGAVYGEDMSLHYVETDNIEGLKAIQKSKYMQCSVNDAFKRIKQELENGDFVLFTGTGCHVKGLRSFLKRDYENLLTADLVCHGVPGQGVFRKYKQWLEKKYADVMTDYIPRPKRDKDGQETGYYSLARFKGMGDIKLEMADNSYFVGFQHNLFLRSACHNCRSNGEERYSDFTLADFWGLGKIEPFTQYKQRTLGISMLALNSLKAKMFFECFKDTLVYEQRSYKEASLTNTQYYKPAIPSPLRKEFRREWNILPWSELAGKYMRFSHKELVLYGIKKFTPDLLLHAKLLAKWIK